MFNDISWQAYWTTLSLILAGYYLILYLVYFRPDFKVTSFLTKLITPVKNHQQALFDSAGDFQRPPEESEEAVVYAYMDELSAFFEQSKKVKCIKEELICALQTLLKKYPTLKTSQYKDSFTNVMVTQCEHMCSIHLSADDLVRVWFG